MKRPWLAALAATILLSAFTGCDGDGASKKGASKKPEPVAAANFALEDVGGVDAGDRPEAQTTAQSEAQKIKQLIDTFYNSAFVQPAKWNGGQHPDIAGLLSADAQGGLATNLPGLALTDSAPSLARVKITTQRITKLRVLLESDLTTSSAIGSVAFTATATPKAKGAQPIDVVHNMNVWLRQEGGSWKIYAYGARLKMDSKTKAAAFGTPAGGGA